MDAIVVEVTRGQVVEARHVVHAVALRDGRIELAAGDRSLVTFLRSSAKPIQALPAVRARPDLDDEEIALMCASHLADPEQLAVVRRLLADAPARFFLPPSVRTSSPPSAKRTWNIGFAGPFLPAGT